MWLALRRMAFAAALIVTTVLMLVPSPGTATSNDKTDHLLVFGTLTLLGAWALIPTRWLVPGLIAYAALTELLQATVTQSRHGDLLDVAADSLGIVIGLLVAAVIANLRTARRASSDPSRPPG